ncbi:MAG: hypothetical protein ACW99U_17460 [Candidatus Thorarchaeota archaeon]|jgi:hypothetical protein
MKSVPSEIGSSLRKVRLTGIVFFAYVIVLPLITLLIPESEVPVNAGPLWFPWLLVFLMPLEILLVYLIYRSFSKRIGTYNLMGPAILMYTLAIAPSIYSFLIGFLDSALRHIGILLGLLFSLLGFWLASMLLSRLDETIQMSNH